MSEHGAPTLPWSQEAEQSILGGLLLSPDALARLADRPPQAEHFFAESHRDIWVAINELAGRHLPIDVITVHVHLAQQGRAERVGGLKYLNALSQSVPSAANMRRYADIVIERALLRKIIETADVAQTIAREPGDADEKLDRVASMFAAIKRPSARSAPRSVSELIAERLPHWEALEAGTIEPGLRTHLPTLDSALCGGLKPGKVIVLAARPSVGKTSLAGQIALNVAADGAAVLILSQEMQAGDIIDRAVANLGRVGLGALVTGRFERDDWRRVSEAAEIAARLPLYVDDQPALTLLDMRAKARQVQQRHGLAVLVVDYLQLCGGAGRQETRHHQIEQISRGLKALAKELGICILLLSQINRQSTQRADGEPTLADLKESGAIEEDADTVIVLHPRGALEDGSLLIAALLLKNRQGRRGRIALSFAGGMQRWVESTADVTGRGAA